MERGTFIMPIATMENYTRTSNIDIRTIVPQGIKYSVVNVGYNMLLYTSSI